VILKCAANRITDLYLVTILSQHPLLFVHFLPACLHQFSSMVLCLRCCMMQWFNLFLKGPSNSANYSGIALASSLSKVHEWSILLTWEYYFTTSDLQFGFNSGYSTTLCTGVMKAIISHYVSQLWFKSICLFHLCSNAFDMVNHRILVDKILSRGMPKPLAITVVQVSTSVYQVDE